MTDRKLKILFTKVRNARLSCDEALDGDWDKSDEGFRDMRDDLLDAETTLITEIASEAVADGKLLRDIEEDSRCAELLGVLLRGVLLLKSRNGFVETSYGRKTDAGLARTVCNVIRDYARTRVTELAAEEEVV